MFVELIEHLRCPAPHEPSALVASALRTDHRHIVDGMLGCPMCGAEFPIEHGVARFGGPARNPETVPPAVASTEEAMRLAAFLELTDARGFAILCGPWAAHAPAVRELSDVALVLVNPVAIASERPAAASATLLTGDVLPLAPGSARALAIAASESPAFVASAVDAVRGGGRVVGASAQPVPPGVTELVRDARVWVGEKTAAPPSPADRAPQVISIARPRR